MADFSIFMQNDLKFSECTAPHLPVRDGTPERLRVELRGDLLTTAEARKDGETGSTIYAQRTLDLDDGQITFMILPKLPDEVVDNKFFPAIGTIVIGGAEGARTMRAAGTDTNGGTCQGWIFNARETA